MAGGPILDLISDVSVFSMPEHRSRQLNKGAGQAIAPFDSND